MIEVIKPLKGSFVALSSFAILLLILMLGNFVVSTAAHAINGFFDPEPRKQDSQLLSNQGESLSEVFQDRRKNGLLLTPKAEGVHSERKVGKVSRSSSGLCSKRPRVVKLQDPSLAGVEGIKDMSHKLSSCSLKSTSSGKLPNDSKRLKNYDMQCLIES